MYSLLIVLAPNQEEIICNFSLCLSTKNKKIQQQAIDELVKLHSQHVVEESVFATLCENVLESPFEMDNLRLFIQNKEGQKLLREVRHISVLFLVSLPPFANRFCILCVTQSVMQTPFPFATLVQQMQWWKQLAFWSLLFIYYFVLLL